MTHRIALPLMAVLALGIPSAALAEPNSLFSDPGHVTVSLGTGVPYVAIGEVAYGLCSHVTLGAIGGLTPTTWGAGVRGRVKLFDGASNRVAVTLPVLYYPPSQGLGNAPWLLAMPSLLAEHRLGERFRVHVGAGVAAATWLATSQAPQDDLNAHTAWVDDDWKSAAPTHGLWETVTVGASAAVSAHVSVFADASAVLDGAALATDWIGGPPAVVSLGASRTF